MNRWKGGGKLWRLGPITHLFEIYNLTRLWNFVIDTRVHLSRHGSPADESTAILRQCYEKKPFMIVYQITTLMIYNAL